MPRGMCCCDAAGPLLVQTKPTTRVDKLNAPSKRARGCGNACFSAFSNSSLHAACTVECYLLLAIITLRCHCIGAGCARRQCVIAKIDANSHLVRLVLCVLGFNVIDIFQPDLVSLCTLLFRCVRLAHLVRPLGERLFGTILKQDSKLKSGT